MPDQARPAEIEDVLSSIRRLVAGEGQRAPEAPTPPADTSAEASRAPEDDALILTPSLRVSDEEAGASDPHQEWTEDAAAESEAAPADQDTSAAEPADAPEEPIASAPEPDAPQSDADEALIAEIVEREVADGASEMAEPAEDGPSAEAEAAPEVTTYAEEVNDLESTSAEEETASPNEGALAGHEADADAEPRKSPFLPETLVAQRVAETERSPAAQEERRSGFGFGGARREDPVRHVPISDLRPASSVQDASSDASGEDTAAAGDTSAATAPPSSSEERTLHLSVAKDAEGAPIPATEETPTRPRGALISPGFAVQSAGEDDAPDETQSFRRATEAHASETDEQPGSLDEAPTDEPSQPEMMDEASEATASVLEDDPADEALAEDSPGAPHAPSGEELAEEANEHLPENLSTTPEPTAETMAVDALESDTSASVSDMDQTSVNAPDEAEPMPSVAEDEAAEEPDFLPDGDDTQADDAEQAPVIHAETSDNNDPATVSETRETDGPVDASANLNVFGGPASSMDEAAFRSLIRDVVHEELQGTLGARVSQNIRLLIRREVARAIEESAKIE